MSNINVTSTYNHLLDLIHPSPSRVLEIDILPSALVTSIQYSAPDSALAIPQKVLIECFLYAREIFFTPSPHAQIYTYKGREDGSGDEAEEGELEEEKLKATSVLLLYDPNHQTAINWRKRYLLSHRSRQGHQRLVERELIWLESLLTSPLPKHTKSPTLWGHRLWLFRTIRSAEGPRGDVRENTGEEMQELWKSELRIVMVAGEKHTSNYYGWNYARDVLSLFFARRGEEAVERDGEVAMETAVLAQERLETVQRWCYRHPKDCSGWAFLECLCRRAAFKGAIWAGGQRLVEDLVIATRDWKESLAWKGFCVDEFLRRMEPTNDNTNEMKTDTHVAE
ncbi:uncharacterized protein KY384_006891 [Bacidia gigantensis]|uniref:uncharacterized protein n=1 Tax=Bacidia gigantensis TaxID=2732470 RepID=UPI001D0535C1|nr:uncharacterized protein KY384_006891 [Bacidia gigantensis]KAG8527975.1 hypothetical protein KY384_006891 [Bacidia gigantensis]